MPERNYLYVSSDAPTTPHQGDVRINQSDNTMQVYSGSAWAAPRFINLTVDSGGFTVTAGATSIVLPAPEPADIEPDLRVMQTQLALLDLRARAF